MKKQMIAVIAFVLLVGILAYCTPASRAADGMSSPIRILSPTCQTYNSSSPIFLKTEIVGLGGKNVYYSMIYSLNGQANVTLPFKTQNQEWPLQITMIGQTTLPQLTEGTHNIIAYQRLEINYHSAPPKTDILWDSSSVNFTVDDQKPTSIENLSIQNQTYSQNSLQLNLTLDEPTSWIGYSLDNQKNITTNGNTTLTNLTGGSHSVQFFANDTVGNMAKTNVTYFTIAQTNSNNKFDQASIILATGALVLVAAVSLFRFKRRKPKPA